MSKFLEEAKDRIYELLDGGKDLNCVYDFRYGAHYRRKCVPSYFVINYVYDHFEVVKLWRMLLNNDVCPDFSLFIAVRGYKRNYILNDLVKWSLAHGGNPKYVYREGREGREESDKVQFLVPYDLSMTKLPSIDYYVLMLLRGATPDMFKLFLEADVLCNKSSAGLVIGEYAMTHLLEILDLVEVGYTCMVTILVEANF